MHNSSSSSGHTRATTHAPRGVPPLKLKARQEERSSGDEPLLSSARYLTPRADPLITPQTQLEEPASEPDNKPHVSVVQDANKVVISINKCVRPINDYLALEGSYFSTKYENGSQDFKDRVHRLVHLTEDFQRNFADRPEGVNKPRLRELAFELAQILELRDANGWTAEAEEGAQTAANHYTKPARNTNNLIAAVSAGSTLAIAGTALFGTPVATGAISVILGVTTPIVFGCATLWQTMNHPIGLAGLAQQGPMFMPTVKPRDVIDWQGNTKQLRVCSEIKWDIELIQTLLQHFRSSGATADIINGKLKELQKKIRSVQRELAKELDLADQADYADAIGIKNSAAVDSLMFMASKRGRRPDLYLTLLRLKKDREFCWSLLSDALWTQDPPNSPRTRHLVKKVLARQNAHAQTVGDSSHITKEMLRKKLGSLKLELTRSELYLALNIQKQAHGRAIRGGFNLGAASLNLTSAAASYHDHLLPDHLPQDWVLGFHPSTLSLAGAVMTLAQASVFGLTQPRFGKDDQLTRLSAMLEIKLLERGLRKKPFNPDSDDLLGALDESNPFDPKRLDAIAQGWGKVRCAHIGRILDFDRDCYILAIITHILPPQRQEKPTWTKPFRLTRNGEVTRLPATAEDLLVVLRKCKSKDRKDLIRQIAPWALNKKEKVNKVKRLLAIIEGLEMMAAEVKAMKVGRVLTNGSIVVDWVTHEELCLLQPKVRDIFEQSLLYARTNFLLKKGRQTLVEQPSDWILSELQKGDRALIHMRGLVDWRTAGTTIPEFAQKAGQHYAYSGFLGAYSPQLIKALGFVFSGIAQMLTQEQAARIITMAFSSTAILCTLLTFGLLYSYQKHIALKFALQNRNQALGTVDVPNTEPGPFTSQFETLAATPIRETDLGSGDLNLQSDLSFLQDYLAQMQAAPIGGFKDRDGNWRMPFRKWAAYFSKKPEDLDKLDPQEVEADLAQAFQDVLKEMKNIENMEKAKLEKKKGHPSPEDSDSADGHHLIDPDEVEDLGGQGVGNHEDVTVLYSGEELSNFFDYDRDDTSSLSDNEGDDNAGEGHGDDNTDRSDDELSESNHGDYDTVFNAGKFWHLQDEDETGDTVITIPVDA